ncbi:MAG: response regulator transcription factor [Eubacterium sp.]|jgi:DNA-binding response OmpR family regulator
MPRVLIADDERDIVDALEIFLKPEGYEIIKAYTGAEAVEAVSAGGIGLVLLDIMMPVMDGITALKKIREISNVPVIIITAKSEDADKILGLGIGADDYITKPFNPAEVIARVKSQLRRYMELGSSDDAKGSNIISSGGLRLNDAEKSVTVDGRPVKLTAKEYSILYLLMTNPGRVFSANEIYEKVWGEKAIDDGGTIAVHIRHIREKIEIDPADPRYVVVVWGQGYRFRG